MCGAPPPDGDFAEFRAHHGGRALGVGARARVVPKQGMVTARGDSAAIPANFSARTHTISAKRRIQPAGHAQHQLLRAGVADAACQAVRLNGEHLLGALGRRSASAGTNGVGSTMLISSSARIGAENDTVQKPRPFLRGSR